MKYSQCLVFLLSCLCFSFTSAQTLLGTPIDGTSADQSGFSTSLSADGSRVAIGSPKNSDLGPDFGKTQVFEFTGGNWQQLGSDLFGTDDYDAAGWSVALSADGNTVAFGSPNVPPVFDPYTTSGYVRVYSYSGGAWTQLGSDITGQNIGDEFGYSVAISADGSRVIVGARFNSVSATTAGSVTVYDLTGGVWTQVGSTILGDAADDQMGWAVAISDNGERIAVGAPLNDRNGTNSGIVRIFELIGGVWIQVGSDIEGSNVGDNVGYSVALSADGKRVVISVIGNDDAAAESGQVRVFELVGSTWTQIGSGVNGVNSGDRFGWSVSMSDDGNRFAAGAVFSDPNGSSSGKVSVYEYSGTSWDQVGNAIDGEVAGDQLGRSVSLSSDGNQVAVGIPFNDNGGTSAGRVSIYDFSAGLPVELEHFQGEVHKGKVLLNWSTASEVNNWKFAVERSADGKTWQQLGEVLGQGTTYESSIYEYTDYTPLIGANYYRLRQVDWDGSFTYSTILLFDLQESIGSTFKIYPNPVSEILYFDLPVGEKVSLFNSYGQLVREENVNSQGRMDIADLPAGVYWLTTTLSGQQISQRVVKQ